MLTEDDVIDGVRDRFLAQGWELIRRATAHERGEDLVMRLDDLSLSVEAKGAGSSKPGTARYGKAFTRAQVFDHVAKAVLKALRIVSEGRARAGVAFPDNVDHRREVHQVLPALTASGVTVFWVTEDGSVATDGDDAWLQ